jgi:ACS family hexuronate transporter-like MFS transporter
MSEHHAADGLNPLAVATATGREDAEPAGPRPADTQGRGSQVRWVVCALLFAATTINYVDRGVLGVLAPQLEKTIGWNKEEYGRINAAFTIAYAIGFLVVGRLIDRVGTKLGYAVSLVVWSLAAAGHALAGSAWGFGVARFFLGLGESGNFPSAIKTTAEWFPRRERALATGIFNAGSNIGAVLAPLIVPVLALSWGWPSAFLITGLLGLIWVSFWLPLYHRPERHPHVSPAELAWIQSDPPEPATPIPWVELFPHRQTWAFAAGKFLTDPIWWFYLFWAAQFFSDTYHVDLKRIGPPLIVIYLLADVGSVAGGWLSSWMIQRGRSPNRARKTALLICALAVVPVVATPFVSNLWSAVLLIALAASAHQGFSANLFTLTSDMFPRRAIGSVVGIGGTAGALGGSLFQLAAGWITMRTGSYVPMFVVSGSVYLLAVLAIHLLVPRLEPAFPRPASPTYSPE